MNTVGNGYTSIPTIGGDERSLPVYLLLDTSTSMAGAAIQAVQDGLERFQKDAIEDVVTRDTVKVGIIQFANEATLYQGRLIPIREFEPPNLEAGGVSRLDLAFEILRDSMDRHITKPRKGTRLRGDRRPMVYVLTDGFPTDAQGYQNNDLWPVALSAVINRPSGQVKPAEVVAVGCGPEVSDETLRAIAPLPAPAFRIERDPDSIKRLLKWVSLSVAASVRQGGRIGDTLLQVPTTPGLRQIP